MNSIRQLIERRKIETRLFFFFFYSIESYTSTRKYTSVSEEEIRTRRPFEIEDAQPGEYFK